MKKINLLFAVLMLLMLGNTNKIFAETVDIDWSSYARSIDKVITTDENNPTYVYLYNVTSKQFITCGKSYGMQCIMANVGMKFYITKSGNSYIIHSNVTTPSSSGIGVGGCLGISWGDVYIDRSDNIYWKFNNVSSSTSTYYIQNNAFLYTDHYLTQNKVLKETTNKGENHSSEWMIITRQDYLTQTAQAKYEQIDVTGLLADSRFDRNSNDATSWKWGSGETGAASNNNENHAIGVIESYAQYGLDWDQYFAAEIDRESNTLSQTVTDLEEGIYRITCQGFYINSYDNANSYLYATNGSDESSILLKDISLNINDFTATDNYDGDLTNKVKVTGEVNNKKEGLYKVTYTVSDSNNNTAVLDTWINVQKKNTSGVPVLMYHWFYDDTKGETYGKVNSHDYMSKSNFESEIKYLVDNNYYFPTYEELEKYIDGKISLPKKSIILTSDDGKESFYNIAGEVIEKYKVPMTSFVITKNKNWKKHTDNKYIVFESHSDNLHNRGCKGDMNGDMMCKKESYILNDLMLSRKKLGDN